MKLLIITQVVDKDHPILGFFHRWIEEFAKHCEQVSVICLQEGRHDLPDNVAVYSLGKEEQKNKLTYLWRFYKLIWQLRGKYDNVFVHMNQVYVILGGIFWRIWGKKVGLWYAHGAVTRSLKVAVKFAHIIFTSTKQGMRVDTEKRVIVGQGIDIDKFKMVEKQQSTRLQLVTVGRVAKSKNIDTLLQACAILKKQGIEFNFLIIGSPTTKTEELYAAAMKKQAAMAGITDNVRWVGAITQDKLPTYLQTATIFIHDGSTNSLDKALVEASLCGCVVVSSNPAYKEVTGNIAPDYLYDKGDAVRLVEIVVGVNGPTDSTEAVRVFFETNFSVLNLISGIVVKY